MNVFISGKGSVSLNQNEFIASGGEGEIYGLGDTVYKIYHDKNKMIPLGKFDELSELTDKYVVNPQEILLNKQNQPIGFTMEWFKNTEAICRVFNNGFRKKHNFNNNDAIKLVENFQKIIEFIHSKNCIVVDFNEINFLLDKSKLTQPILIDVDSYGTKNYRPTAITPFIKDYSTNEYNQLTDWYCFGIIAFQIFIGVHPFRGSIDGFKKGDVVSRLKSNISVFNKSVKLPKATRSLDHIPDQYRSWLFEIFTGTTRINPPQSGGKIKVISPVYTKIISTNHFDIKLLETYPSDLKYCFSYLNNQVVRYNDVLQIGIHKFKLKYNNSEIVLLNNLTPVEFTNKSFRICTSDNEEPFIVDNLKVINNKLIVKTNNKVSVVNVKKFKKYIASIEQTRDVLPLSTELYSGIVIQNILGNPYIWVPDQNLEGMFIRIPELINHKIINAKAISNVAIIITHKDGEYNRLIIKTSGEKYDIRQTNNIAGSQDINFTILDTGIVILNVENIELFSSKLTNNNIKIIDDPRIDAECVLSSIGSKVLFHKENKLYQLKMK